MVADAMTTATQEEMQSAMVVMRAEFDDKLKLFLVDVASKSTVAAMQASWGSNARVAGQAHGFGNRDRGT